MAKLKSKKVKLFNANGKEDMVSMKIKSVKRTNQGIILTGTGKCPVDVVRTKKQRKSKHLARCGLLKKVTIKLRILHRIICIAAKVQRSGVMC